MSKNKKEVLQEVATSVVSAGFRKTLSDHIKFVMIVYISRCGQRVEVHFKLPLRILC